MPAAPKDKNAMRYSLFSVYDHYPDRERSVAEFYRQSMDQCVLADGLGYDTFFCAEHHFHEYGAVPDPAVMLAAMAERTERIRLGPAISVLPFRDPRTVAESYAMVDLMSAGRLVLGVGSGYLVHEFKGFAVDGATKRDHFNEDLDIVRRLLAGERLTYEGRFGKGEDVVLNVLPHNGRVPPIYVAVLARDACYHVGRQGNLLFTVPYASCDSFDDIPGMVTEFRKGREEAGLAPDDEDSIWTFHCHVADDDDQLRAHVKEPFDLYVRTRLYAKQHVYEDIMESGLALFGTVEAVADKMLRLYDMGIRHIALLKNFGLLAPDLVERSMRLIADEVMPRVEVRIAERAAA